MKYITLSILFIANASCAISQNYSHIPKWEIGMGIGSNFYLSNDIGSLQHQSGINDYQISIRNVLSKNINLALLYGRFQHTYDGKYSIENNVQQISLLGEWDIRGHRRYREHLFKRTFSPYLTSGLRLLLKESYVGWPADLNGKELTDKNQIVNSLFAIPAGIGLRYDLSKRVNIGIEGNYNFVLSDYLEGISYAGDNSTNDRYAKVGIQLNVRLGKFHDHDSDGIKDHLDHCWKEAGPKELQGCPDSDGDGILDRLDQCPNDAGLEINFGCPDSDQDGIIDSKDQCPKIPGSVNGCPDSDGDGDGIIDIDDSCPEIPGTINGCPDADGDNIIDKEDQCPDVPGSANFHGCPDTDHDLVPDHKDHCPATKGKIENNGCPYPDSDKDGIIDKDDECPNKKGPLSNKGCPTKEERVETFSIFFETNKSELSVNQQSVLNEILQVIAKNPNAKVKLTGKADHVGPEAYNYSLSESRISTIKEWLLLKGIPTQQISSEALGEDSNSVTDNNLAKYRVVEVIITFE